MQFVVNMTRKIKVAMAGLGSCASAIIQGLEHYKNADDGTFVPGLMHVRFGPYHINDLEIVAAFDINTNKIERAFRFWPFLDLRSCIPVFICSPHFLDFSLDFTLANT